MTVVWTGWPDESRITGATVQTSVGGVDWITVTTDERIDEADLLAAFAEVSVSVDGVIYKGWLDEAPRQATPQGEGKVYRFAGPMRWLRREPFVDSRYTAGSLMGRKSSTEHERVFTEVERVCAYARTKGVSVGTIATQVVPERNIEIPWERFSSVSCADALARILRWVPSVAVVQSVSGGLQWVDMLSGTAASAEVLSGGEWELLSVSPRYDLLRESAEIRFLWSAYVPVGEETLARVQVTTDYAAGGPAGAMRERVEYDLASDEVVPAAGIAAEYMRWSGRLQIEGTLVVPRALPLVRVGSRLAMDGLLARWAGHEVVVMQSSIDLWSERTTLTLGPRRHLGLDGLYALARRGAASVAPVRVGPEAGEHGAPSGTQSVSTPFDASGEPTYPSGGAAPPETIECISSDGQVWRFAAQGAQKQPKGPVMERRQITWLQDDGVFRKGDVWVTADASSITQPTEDVHVVIEGELVEKKAILMEVTPTP